MLKTVSLKLFLKVQHREKGSKTGYRYSSVGENTAKGETNTETIAIEGWMNSTGHCRKIMNNTFTDMCVTRSGIY